MNQPLSKKELTRQVKAFLDDKDRGISLKLFAELCGISEKLLKEIFLYERRNLTENVQIRINRALEHWKQGNVRIMKRLNNTRYVDYRRQPQPVIEPSVGLQVTSGGIKLKIGPKNRRDYSGKSLDEQLRG